MLKNIVKFLLIIQLTIVLGVVFNIVSESEMAQSLNNIPKEKAKGVFLMDEEGNAKRSLLGGRMLNVQEDNMTITGTASGDCMVTISGDVNTVTLEDLDQNGHDIEIYIEGTKDLKVIFKGENQVYDIFCDSNLTVEGTDTDSSITLTNSIYVYGKKLNISTGTITTPQIYSDGTITIEGDTKIYLETCDGQDKEYIYARLEAYDLLTIDLSGDGVIDIKGDLSGEIIPTYAPKEIVLGENTVIVTPEGGYCDLYDPEWDDEYTIFDADGEEAEHVVFGVE